ncbi:MAG: lipid-A-disaccharide synthase [Candidatus Omnitrophota bacterium]
MAQIKQIFIVCGEPSGDLQAGELAKAIKKIDPQIKISGIGGESLSKTAAEIYRDIKNLSVFGFFEAIKKLPKFLELKRLILNKITAIKPLGIILVDFSGFNLRLARAINKKIPVIYYISPQVWASRPGRIQTIKKYISKMIVLFKFEEDFYCRNNITADFVGHPLLDIVKPQNQKARILEEIKFSGANITIALLPGSRKQEIKNILPIMLETAKLINKKITKLQFIIAKSALVDFSVYGRFTKNLGFDLRIVEARTYDCLEAADFALVCSGTATLETAIMQKPFFIIYKMNRLNYLLYRPQVKIPFIGMVNIVAGKKLIPEFIQSQARPEKIAEEALALLNSPSKLDEMIKGLAEVKSQLGSPGAATRAAKIILDYLNK